MRARLVVLLALLLLGSVAVPAGAIDALSAVRDETGPVDLLQLDQRVLTSDNVTYHGTIPIDSPGVGGEVVHRADLDKTFFYATGAKGLSIYDITDPALPILVSTCLLYTSPSPRDRTRSRMPSSA